MNFWHLIWTSARMRKLALIVLVSLFGNGFAQNLELTKGKDIKQPGKLNPSLTGIQEDLIRIISDAEVGESYQLMIEGKMPLKLGNYMVGMERVYTDNVANNMFNVTYARTSKDEKKVQWRYGGTLNFNQKSLLGYGYDSTSGYNFKDLNGEVRKVANINDIKNNVDYFDVELGVSAVYRNLIVGAGVENIVGNNVSMSTLKSRTLPFTANLMIGGFVGLGDKVTLYPSAIVVGNEDEFYTKGNLDLSTTRFTFSTSYIQENEFQDLSAAIAVKFKKVFAGIKYSHPITSSRMDIIPSYNLFFNSSIFKSRDLFKSDFAKQMRKVY